MTTRMPARCASRIATAASSRGGSIMPTVPDEHQVVLECPRHRAWRLLAGPAAGRPRPACAGASLERDRRWRAPRTQGSVERDDVHAHAHLRAAVQQHVGRALGDHHEHVAVFVVALDRRHQLALRRERDLATRSKRRSRRSVAPSLRSATRNAASVGSPWISHSPPSALAQVRVAGQAAAAEHHDGSSRSGPGGQLRCRRVRPDLAARSRPR